jgi:hypothetical protein
MDKPVVIPHEGRKPPWLEDDAWVTEPSGNTLAANDWTWSIGRVLRLLADHRFAPVLRAGLVPWNPKLQGDGPPKDYAGGKVMLRNGRMRTVDNFRTWDWETSVAEEFEVIGYEPSEATEPAKVIQEDREHWSRQEIVKTIINAMVEAKGAVRAVPAGKAADRILEFLAPVLAEPTPSAPVAREEVAQVDRDMGCTEEDFLAAIHAKTPAGQWIQVQHHPNGDWSVAAEPEGQSSTARIAELERELDRLRSQIAWTPGEPPKEEGVIVYGHTWRPYRWKAYSPKSEQFRHGIKGRWQALNEYAGWDNAPAPDEWASDEAVSARKSLGDRNG